MTVAFYFLVLDSVLRRNDELCYYAPMMRWKILELAGKYSSLDDILAELKNHPGFELEEQAALAVLSLYKDTLSEELQSQLEKYTA